MDYTCKDIPMRLDIKYQPLDFEVYLSQVIDIPRVTSLEQPPYTFQLEHETLDKVDQIIERTRKEAEELEDRLKSHRQKQVQATLAETINTETNNTNINPIDIESDSQTTIEKIPATEATSAIQTLDAPIPTTSATNISIPLVPTNSIKTLPVPSCPTETPLTPIRSDLTTSNTSNTDTQQQQQLQNGGTDTNLNRVNPRDFEEINSNPFDHLELQTIDELRELNLVFQASYANQAARQAD